MRRAGVLLLVVAALLAGAMSPADAITHGLPTGDKHGYTAALLVAVTAGPDGEEVAVEAATPGVTAWVQVCSGVLITPDRVATAGHCSTGIAEEYGVTTVGVSFAADLQSVGSFDLVAGARLTPTATSTPPLVGTLATFWRYDAAATPNGDVGLVRLSTPAEGVTPLALAPVGYLDGLRRRGWLRGASFFTVGYGTSFAPPSEDVVVPSWTPERKVAGGTYRSLASRSLTVARSRRYAYGGPCFGDSGGPIIHRVNGVERLVAVVSTGEGTCTGWTSGARVDEPEARHFLLLL